MNNSKINNGEKIKTPKSGMLINCDPVEKERWALDAKRNGTSLTEWVIEACRLMVASGGVSNQYRIDTTSKTIGDSPIPIVKYEIVNKKGRVVFATNNKDEALNIQFALNNKFPEQPGGGFSEETLKQARAQRAKQIAEGQSKTSAQSQNVVTTAKAPLPWEGEPTDADREAAKLWGVGNR